MTPIVLPASDPLRAAAESFVARLRRGDRPTLAEYMERLPDQASRIRELFPRLLAAERRTGEGATTGPFGPVEDLPGCPRFIGDYQIVREIGRGGMGIVYEAVQSSLGRQVALKVLPAGPCSRGPFLERFRRESRAVAKLHHTNIVPIFGVGDADGLHFYAMQYIEGMGLDAVLKEIRRRRGLAPYESASATKTVNIRTKEKSGLVFAGDFELGPSSILPNVDDDREVEDGQPLAKGLRELAEMQGPKYHRSVARLGVQVAEAIAYAHNQGVLHRDIKPSNLLLDRFGILWITDFGLAKAEGDDMTVTGEIAGTLRYMAPERFQAKSDVRSDIYALGMTLYEMIALKPPFDDEDRLRLVERITRERPARLRQHDPTIPRDLETVILKAIQKEPNHRYESAADMADDLRRFLTDRPIKARRASLLEETQRWCRRNPAIAGLIGLVTLFMMLVIAISVHSNFTLREKNEELERLNNMAKAAEDSKEKRRWESEVSRAELLRSRPKAGRRFEALDALVEANRISTHPVISLNALASLTLADIRKRQAWEGWPPGSVALDMDGTFNRYARSDRFGNVSVRYVQSDEELHKLPGFGSPSRPRFSRMGGHLGVWHERDKALYVWRLTGENPERVIDEPTNSECFDFGPDDLLFASARLDGSVRIFDLVGGGLQRSVELDAPPTCLAFHPRLPLLIAGVRDEIYSIDLESGKVAKHARVPGQIAEFAWQGEGHRLAVAAADGKVHILFHIDEPPVFSLSAHRGGAAKIAFHPNGKMLASAGDVSEDKTLRFWDPYTGRAIFSTPLVVPRLRFRQDGQRFAAEADGNRLAIYELAIGSEYRTLARREPATAPMFRDGAISGDNQWLAMATQDGVAIWKLATGEQMAHLPIGETLGCLFLPNGELVTSGTRGVFAWSLTRSDSTGAWRVGPPRQLVGGPAERLACDQKGRVIGVATRAQGAIMLDPQKLSIDNMLLSHDKASFISVSPDGQLLATGTQDGTLVKLWNAINNRLVRELPVGAGSMVAFSPDSRLLATNGENNGVALWDVSLRDSAGWAPQNKLLAARQSRAAFSPNGQMIAVESGEGMVWIYNPDGNLLAELEDPNRDRAAWLGFSPDGTHLIVASNDNQAIHVWDLAALQQGLSERSIGTGLPPMRPYVLPGRGGEDMVVIGAKLLDGNTLARWSTVMATLKICQQPGEADAWYRRATALNELGFGWCAASDFDRALEQQPDHAEAAYMRGLNHVKARRWENALDDFERAQRSPILQDRARLMHGKMLLQLGRAEEMIASVEDLLKHYPADPLLYYQRAHGHVYRDRFKEAIADLETAVKHGPTNDLALNNYAWILINGPPELRNLERGLGLVQRAVSIAPAKSTYQNTLGAAHYRLGQFREAAAALQRSLEASPGQSDAYNLYFLAMCLARLNEFDRARDCFEKAKRWQQSTRLNPYELRELTRFCSEADGVISAALRAAETP